MTYSYKCTDCGHKWDAQQKITEDAHRDCPVCKKPTAKRLISGKGGFVLKGGRWYRDGYS